MVQRAQQRGAGAQGGEAGCRGVELRLPLGEGGQGRQAVELVEELVDGVLDGVAVDAAQGRPAEAVVEAEEDELPLGLEEEGGRGQVGLGWSCPRLLRKPNASLR